MANIYHDLVKHFGTQKAAGEALGVDQSTVSGWVRGAFKMSPSIAVRAERATDRRFTRRDQGELKADQESAA